MAMPFSAGCRTLLLVVASTILLAGCQTIGNADGSVCGQSAEPAIGEAAPPLTLKPGESVRIVVDARNPWNASGILVRAGQRYTFGIEHVCDWTDGSVPADPIDGWQGWAVQLFGFLIGPLRRSPTAPWYALVGSVGRDDVHAFAVIDGHRGAVRMDHSGALYFYANDMDGRYCNNRGTLNLRILRHAD